MKKILLIFLTFFISGQIFGQYSRFRLNQIQQDTTAGSIVLSSFADSNMTYSRDFYIQDSVLILFGDTIRGGASISRIIVDSIYLFGDGTEVNPITFSTEKLQDTLNAYIKPGLGVETDYDDVNGELLIQSLSIEDSVYNGTASLITKGTPLYVVDIQGNYWSVAPAQANDPTKMPVVAIAGENIAAGEQGLGLLKGHIKDVNTSLFTAGDEIWVGATGGYTNVRPKGEDVLVQKLGTVVKANANGSGIINLGEVQYNLNPNNIFIGGADSLQTTANLPTVLSDSLNNYVTIAGTEDITGAKTFTNTFTQSGGDANFDNNTLYVDASADKVGIGTSSPQGFFSIDKEFTSVSTLGFTVSDPRFDGIFQVKTNAGDWFLPTIEGYSGVLTTLPIGLNLVGAIDSSADESSAYAIVEIQGREYDNFPTGPGPVENAPIFSVYNYSTNLFNIQANGNVGIGTTSPSAKLEVSGGDVNFDSGTLYVDATNNKVGIGTSSPQGFLSVEKEFPNAFTLGFTLSDPNYTGLFQFKTNSSTYFLPTLEGYTGNSSSYSDGIGIIGAIDTSQDVYNSDIALVNIQGREYDNFPAGLGAVENANIFNVTNAGTVLMNVAANGNVGIGTTSPGAALDVNGEVRIYPASGTGVLRFGSNGAEKGKLATDASGNMFFETAGTERMRIDASGSVGVGYTNPSFYGKLVVNGAAYFGNTGTTAGVLVRAAGINNTTVSSSTLWADSAPLYSIQNTSTTTNTTAGYAMQLGGGNAIAGILGIAESTQQAALGLFTGGTGTVAEKMRITSGGNVGIGTNSPAAKLHSNIATVGDASLRLSRTGSSAFEFQQGISGVTGDALLIKDVSLSYDYLTLRSGNVGIGTTSPNERLEISGTGNQYIKITATDGSNAGIRMNAVGQREFGIFSDGALRFYDFTASTDRMRIDASGNVGIGVTPSAWDAGIKAFEIFSSGNGIVSSTSSQNILSTNAKFVGGGWQYGSNGLASTYQQQSGVHTWNIAPSGSANAAITFTQAMTLDANGRLGIGETIPSAKLHVNGSNPFVRINNSSTQTHGIKISYNNSDAHGLHLLYYPFNAIAFIDNTFPITPGQVYGDIQFRQNVNGSMTQRMVIKAENGNVGIGELNPNAPLHVVGRAIASNFVVGPYSTLNDITGIANTLQFGNYATPSLIDQNSADAYVYKASSPISNMAPQTLMFQTRSDADGGGFAFVSGNTPTAKMYIEGSSGNVGIGTTNIGAKLHIVGGGEPLRIESTNNTGGNYVLYKNATGDLGYIGWGSSSSDQMTIFQGKDADIGIYTNSAERMRITSSGNVGIGTNSPTSKFQVEGGDIWLNKENSDNNYYLRLRKNESNDGGILLYRGLSTIDFQIVNLTTSGDLMFYSYGTGSEVLRIQKSTGNVGIGTDSPSEKLDVNGTMRLRQLVGGTNAAIGRASTGEITAASSDIRLKRNITTINNALNKVMALRGVNFYWDNSNDPDFYIDSLSKDVLQIGLIAQEVEEVLPEAVYNNGVKNYKAVRYGEIVSVLIESTKEQQAIIETQEQKITDLETTIQALITRIENLENK